MTINDYVDRLDASVQFDVIQLVVEAVAAAYAKANANVLGADVDYAENYSNGVDDYEDDYDFDVVEFAVVVGDASDKDCVPVVALLGCKHDPLSWSNKCSYTVVR